MLKKLNVIIIIVFILITSYSSVFGVQMRTELNVINKSSETKYLENDQGFISKTIVNSNKDTGEVEIELKLSNTKKRMEVTAGTEIFLIVDNSPSMDFVTSSGKTRKEIVLNSASQLVTSIFNTSNDVKIGLIDFHGYYFYDASINNANVRQHLTDDKEKVLEAINKQLNRSTVGGTNIDAGLKMAQKNFSSSANNKIVILLTDGIPNADTEGNHAGVTTEEGLIIAQNTKDTLLSLKKSGIYTITLLTGMSESDGNTDKDGTEYERENTIEEELAAAENIFGTEDNPVADRYYLISNVDVDKIINEDILKDVTDKIQTPINKVKVVDYFPEDITENFEFSYVKTPSIGEVSSDAIDTTNNKIEWNIESLKGNEVRDIKI